MQVILGGTVRYTGLQARRGGQTSCSFPALRAHGASWCGGVLAPSWTGAQMPHKDVREASWCEASENTGQDGDPEYRAGCRTGGRCERLRPSESMATSPHGAQPSALSQMVEGGKSGRLRK